jgi:hypothetical protein
MRQVVRDAAAAAVAMNEPPARVPAPTGAPEQTGNDYDLDDSIPF